MLLWFTCLPVQVETYPNQYGLCECTDPLCINVFALCQTTFSVQLDLFSGGVPGSTNGPSQVTTVPAGVTVWAFNGANTVNNNWLDFSSTQNANFLSMTDDFTISMWIRVATGTNAQYILACDRGTSSRYFHIYETSTDRIILYYFRDTLDGVTQQNDDGYESQVALSFYYDRSIFQNGIRDNQWHFMTLTVDYPTVTFSFDGYELMPTRGNYRNQFNSQVLLNRDGSIYEMPARILTKSSSLINDISCRLGGSTRGNTFALGGEIRQPTVTNILSEADHRCLASCNEYIDVDPSVAIASSFQTFYNPVSRSFEFTSLTATDDSQYTLFLQGLVFYSNGFIPPEEEGESRRVQLQITDDIAVGNTAEITITGRSNQFNPILDVNGDQESGIDFSVDFVEGVDTEVPIVSDQAFIIDQDIDPQVVSMTVTLTNNQLSVFVENLVVSSVSSVITVTGSGSNVITITASDPARVTPNNFLTVVNSIRYRNTDVEPLSIPRIIEFELFDGLRSNNPRARTTVNVMTFNDAPEADLSGPAVRGNNAEADYIEAGPPTLVIPAMTIQDEDSFIISQANVRIAVVFDVGSERLIINPSLASGAGITCSPSNCEGTDITLTGTSSLMNYQTVLQSLRYVNDLLATDLPNLRDRDIFLIVFDNEGTSSDPNTNVILNFVPINPRVIIQLDAPNQDYAVNFTETQVSPVSLVRLVRIVDSSIETLDSVVVFIRPNLPPGIVEDQELLQITSTANLSISVEINTALKRITFSQTAPVAEYLDAINRVLYFNGEAEPVPITRFVDFVVNPGGGAPNDTATTNITIFNINDQSPECSPVDPTMQVREDTPPNSIVYTLLATDSDVGADGAILYSITNGDTSLFNITTVTAGNERNGNLYLLSDLDRETVDSYTIEVTACDMGSPQLCCSYIVTIEVTDANDLPPVFADPAYFTSVTENNGTDLIRFAVTDGDIGINEDIVDLRIDTNSYNQRAGCIGNFQTRVESGVPILSTSGVDFEEVQVCTFVVIATDGGTPSMEGRANVTVTIVNQDDFPPEFEMNVFLFPVEEENSFPLIIGRLVATDIDSPDDSLVFSPATIGGQFSIDPNNGSISILFEGDRDVQTNYNFGVTVSDPAGNTDTAMVTVEITAINNDAPVLDLNATDPTSLNARTSATFIEEGPAVVIPTDPQIIDPDEVAFSIAYIQVSVANSGDSSQEVLSINADSALYTIISCPTTSPPSAFCVQPVAGATEAQVNDLLQSFTYQNTENEFTACRDDLYSCVAGPLSRTLLFVVNDNRFSSVASEAYVILQPVNDAPVLDLDTSAAGVDYEARFREGEGPIDIVSSNGYSITDDDNAQLQSLNCDLTNPQDGSDEFLLLNASAVPPSLTAVLSPDAYAISITGAASVGDYTTIMRLIQYNSITNNPDVTIRVVQCSVSDGLLSSEVASTAIDYRTVNQIPELDLDTTSLDVGYSVNFVEDGSAISLTNSALLTDGDNTNMQRLTVTLMGAAGPQEVLSVDATFITTPLTSSYTFPILTINGEASTAIYQSIINSVSYLNTDGEIADDSTRMAVFVVQDASSGDSVAVVTNITITPVDDNSPVFSPNNRYTFNVDENSAVNTLVGTVIISDDDLPSGNDVPLFSIISSVPAIGMSDFIIRNNPALPYTGQVLVNGQLDYDSRADTYLLVVQASSGLFSITGEVTVNINNLPDLPPQFTFCPSEFSVMENENIGVPLIPPGCVAVDPDNLDPITYFIHGNVVEGVRLIDINPSTGAIFVDNNIDRESVGVSFSVIISALDSTLSTIQNSTIIIRGENEFSPEFDAVSYSATVTENNAPNPSPLRTVVAADRDESPDLDANPNFVSRITYSFVDPTPFFSINNVTGEVLQQLVVDREQNQQFVLQVVASDNDPTPDARTRLVTLFIEVRNVNDEAPQFINLDNIIIVSEDEPVRRADPFYTIGFNDPDSDSSLQLVLTPPSVEFLLNSANGQLRVNTDLDADTEPRMYSYNLTLTDINTDPLYANTSMSVTEEITIVLRDTNDNVPQFTMAIFEGSITENEPAGSIVLTVAATDADYGFDPNGVPNGNNQLRYSLQGAPLNTFAIDMSTGVITKLRVLDREEQSTYEFTVVVQDTPLPVDGMSVSPQTNTAIIQISVLDVNELPPQADPDRYFVSIPEDTPIGSSLDTTVPAYWRTGGDSGVYLRELREASVINSDTGILICSMYTLTDGGSFSLQDVYYINGDNCLNVSQATPILLRSLVGMANESAVRELTIPLADDTRSDLLGIFNLNPTDDTSDR